MTDRSSIKIPFWASVFTLMGAVILCALGLWQVQRLQWKTDLLADVDRAMENLESGQAQTFNLERDVMRDDAMISGRLRGRFLHDHEIFIQSRTHKKVPGYHLVVPFVVEQAGQDVTVLVVNRGWVPIEAERDQDFTIHRPAGDVELFGVLVRQGGRGFLPDNSPARDMWYHVDVREIEAYLKIGSVLPKILYASGVSDHSFPVPVARSLRGNIKNNHAQYSLFWFSMMIVLIGVYFARFVFPQIKKAS